MKQDEREQLEVLLRKQLKEQPGTDQDRTACPDPGWISAYLEGELSHALKAPLESHLSECRRCQEELAFLLKIFPNEPVRQEENVEKIENKLHDWLSLGWLKPVFLKPVFAILLVTVLSGVVGYKIIFEHKREEDKAAQIADALKKPVEPPIQNLTESLDGQSETRMKDRPALDSAKPEGKSTPEEKKPDSNERPQSSNEERRYNARRESQSTLTRDNSKNGKTDVFREETNQLREKGPKREDMNNQPAAAPQAAAATVTPPPGSVPALNKVTAEQDLEVKEQQLAQDKKVEGQLPAGKDSTGHLTVSGVMSKKAMTAKQKSNESDEADSASKAGGGKREIGLAEAIGSPSSQPRQIRLSGKTFELRDNVWVDLAIGKEGEYSPIVIRKGSSEYHELEKELSIYQDVLNRPEDCLIRINEHIYRIQKK